MKRLLILVFLVLLIAGLTTATTITFWHTQVETERAERIRALATIFKATTGIDVEIVPVEENDLLTQIPVAKASGTLPDVIEGGIEPMLLLGSEGILSASAAAEIIEEFGDIYKGASRLLSDGMGGYYAVPFHAWVQGIWYHKDSFEAKNLEDPLTWYNILTAAKELHDPENGVYGIILPKKDDAYAEQIFTEIALANDARPFDDAGNVTFNTPEMIQTFRFYKELGEYSKPGFTTVLDALNGYLVGEAGMIFYSTYIMDDIAVEEVQRGRIEDYDPELVVNTGFANYMTNKRPTSYGQVVALGVLENSKNELEAKEFIKFLMTGSNYIYWLHMAPGGMNPTRSTTAADPAFLENPVLERYGTEKLQEIIAALENVERFDFYEGKVLTEMSKLSGSFVIGKAINLMFANDWTPEDTAEWAQSEAMKVLGK